MAVVGGDVDRARRLLFLLSPTAGRNGHVHWYGWVFGIVLNLVLAGLLVLLAARRSARGSGSAYRAALLGIAGVRRSA